MTILFSTSVNMQGRLLQSLCRTPLSRWKLPRRKRQHKTWLYFVILIPSTPWFLNNRVVICRHFQMHSRESKLPYFDSVRISPTEGMLSWSHRYAEDWTFCKHFRMLHWLKTTTLWSLFNFNVKIAEVFANWTHGQNTICLVNDLVWSKLQTITWVNDGQVQYHMYMYVSLDLNQTYTRKVSLHVKRECVRVTLHSGPKFRYWALTNRVSDTSKCHDNSPLTLKRLGHFFQYLILFPNVVQQGCNIFIWNWSNKFNV